MMKRILLGLIRFYRKVISPRKPAVCKYIPTCSEYGLIAVERFGALRGGALTLWRILRCNPWSRGGYDPVPEKKPGGKGVRRSAPDEDRPQGCSIEESSD